MLGNSRIADQFDPIVLRDEFLVHVVHDLRLPAVA